MHVFMIIVFSVKERTNICFTSFMVFGMPNHTAVIKSFNRLEVW